MDGEDEGRAEAGEDEAGGLVVVPVPRGAAPAHGERPVEILPDRVSRAVAERREVGDQPHEPEDGGNRRVGRHGEDVPDERASEVDPHSHRVRVGEEPVEDLRAAEVEDRVHAGTGDREERHRLGEPVDRRPPLLPEEEEDRGDQRPGVADADPPDEVDDVEAPADGDVDAPDADALHEEVRHGVQEHEKEEERDREAEDPPPRCLVENRRRDLVGDGGGRVPRRDDRRARKDGRHQACPSFPCPGVPVPVARAGWGFESFAR